MRHLFGGVETVKRFVKVYFNGNDSNRSVVQKKRCGNAVQYSEFRANSVSQGKRKVAQRSWMVKNILNTVKIFRANSVFQGKSKSLKNPERWKIFQYNVVGVYSLGVIRVISASVMCNLDQSRDWL